MRNNKFRWLSALLTTVMVATAGVPAVSAKAAEITEPEAIGRAAKLADVVDTVAYQFDLPEGYVPVAAQSLSADSAVQGRDASYWAKYRSDYFLRSLTADEKEFFRRYEEVCNAVMNDTTTDIPLVDLDGEGWFSGIIQVDISGLNIGNHLTTTQLLYMFKLCNPQYIFVPNWWISPGYLTVYPEFCSAAYRAAAVNEFCDVMDGWLDQINAAGLPEQREKLAHDLVCDWTEYDYDAYYGYNDRMNWDQGAFSLIHDHLTVCAGYSAVSGCLLNATGLETLNVTGDGHAWNMVQLHNNWYLFDTTWDDGDNGGWDYMYYNRNGVEPNGSYVRGHSLENDYYANWEDSAPSQLLYSNCDPAHDSVSTSHEDPYFVDGNYRYFVSNGCTTYGVFSAEVVEALNGASEEDHPAYVEYQGKRYKVNYTPDATAQVKAFVRRLYNIFLDRTPESDEVEGWTNHLVTGALSAGEVAGGFIFSEEFCNRNLCTPHFLEYLYRGLFDRMPDEDGYNGWVLLINDGYCRERVAQGFLTSPEFIDLCESFGVNPGTGLAAVPTYGTIQKAHCTIAGCGNEAPVVTLVVGLYNTVFGRTPAQEEIDFWVDMMAAHRPDVTARVMVNSFLNGQEYANLGRNNTEYVTDLYHAIFNREPDGSGLSDWVDRLDNQGWTREQVLNGFTSSQEFMDQCLRTGIEVGPEV